jgi:hypothetical protein
MGRAGIVMGRFLSRWGQKPTRQPGGCAALKVVSGSPVLSQLVNGSMSLLTPCNKSLSAYTGRMDFLLCRSRDGKIKP